MYDKPKLVSNLSKPIIFENSSGPKLVVRRNKPFIESVYLYTVGDGVFYGVEFWGAFELGDNEIGTPLAQPQLVAVNFKPKVR